MSSPEWRRTALWLRAERATSSAEACDCLSKVNTLVTSPEDAARCMRRDQGTAGSVRARASRDGCISDLRYDAGEHSGPETQVTTCVDALHGGIIAPKALIGVLGKAL